MTEKLEKLFFAFAEHQKNATNAFEHNLTKQTKSDLNNLYHIAGAGDVDGAGATADKAIVRKPPTGDISWYGRQTNSKSNFRKSFF